MADTSSLEVVTAEPLRVLLLGGIILDRYFEVERYPQAGQDALIRRAYDRVGGCCINVAVTLKNLGDAAYIANQFGEGEVGKKIEEYVEALGLAKDFMLKMPARESGYCLTILEGSGERTFFTFKGSEADFAAENFPGQSYSGFRFAYITGYFLLKRETAAQVIALARQLRQDGCQILFDPGPLVDEMDITQLGELVKGADWIVPNAGELALLQKKLEFGAGGMERLFEQGVKGVVVKKGSMGVDVYAPATQFSVGSFPVLVKDTTGAGDSFAGGLMHGLANGCTLGEAVALGNACGALTSTIEGPHGAFSLEELVNFMASFKENHS
jgi:ribokinase